MRVLILAQYFPPDIGGAATRALNVANGLQLNGCEVTVVTAFPHYPHGKIPREYGRKIIKTERLGKVRLIRTFILPLESKGLTRRIFLFASFAISSLFALPMIGKTDVIWAANPDILSILPAITYAKLKRCPIAINVDDLAVEDVYDLRMVKKGSAMSRAIEFLARVAYRKAKAITPISPGYVEPLLRRYGIQKKKIHVVMGGVDVARFKPDISQRPLKKTFTVLCSGAFSPAYNFTQVLKAAKIIENKDKGINFIIQGIGELANYIESTIRDLNLKNVKLINRLLSRDEVAELLNKADVLVQPLGDFGKPHLGISTKLYEYQAVGKPIICCSGGTPGVYVSETKSGLVVKPGNHEALAAAIVHLKMNPEVARKLGENGRKHVETNLSVKSIGFQMKKILDTLK